MEGKVYLAGGWFSPSQEERLYAVKKIIEDAGFSVFFPKEDNLCPPDADEKQRKASFDGNCMDIKKSDLVVGITDERDIGTIWELGYAYAVKKPIVYFAETLGNRGFNLMLAQSGIAVALSRDELSSIMKDIKVNGISNKEFSGNIE